MMQGDSKNARRKARRYSPAPAPVGGLGERAVWRELTEGSGVAVIDGRAVRCQDGTAFERKRAARRAGIAWRCGVNVEMGG